MACMQVHVAVRDSGPNVTSVTLHVRSSDSVSSLMQKIHETLGFETRLMTIRVKVKSFDSSRYHIYRGKDDCRITLFDACIDHGTTVDLNVYQMCSFFQLFVKTLTGKTITLDASSHDTICRSKPRSRKERVFVPTKCAYFLPANNLKMSEQWAIT